MSIKRRLEQLETRARQRDNLDALSDEELSALILTQAFELSVRHDTSPETKGACLALIEAHEAGTDTEGATACLLQNIRTELAAENLNTK